MITTKNEQLSIFDWLEASEPANIREVIAKPPDAEWWQWNANNSMAVHQRRTNGFVSSIETVKPGNKLYTMCRNGLSLLSWVDAFDKYYTYKPLEYLDMVTLCVHGRNIKRYIDAQGISSTSFSPNRSEEYVIETIISAAKTEVYRIAFEGKAEKIKKWARGIGKDFGADAIAQWYGTGGSGGPDSIYITHNPKGLTIDWSRSEPDSIYPIKLTWRNVHEIMLNMEGTP